ncbi:MAG: hypothetical protein RLZZ216_1591 [Cyanobacteriota bacterium]
MPNELIHAPGQRCSANASHSTMDLHQGDCIRIDNTNDLFQVISIDGVHNRCWVRRWPLQPKGGSGVFEISLQQITHPEPALPHSQARRP